MVHSVSQRRLSRVIKCVSMGQVTAEHGNKGVKGSTLSPAEQKDGWSDTFTSLVMWCHTIPRLTFPAGKHINMCMPNNKSDMLQQNILASDIISLTGSGVKILPSL